MSVVNGQLANQTTFNNAFMSRTAATTSTVAKVALQNADEESGAFIANIQRALNLIFSVAAIDGETDEAALDYDSENVIVDGENHKQSLERLDERFSYVTGHKHDNTFGNGPKLTPASLTGYKLKGYYVEGTDFTTSAGFADDVSAIMTDPASYSDDAPGAVCNDPYNKVFIRDVNSNPIRDTLGNEVYGKLTNITVAFILEYYVLVAGVETVYTWAAPTDIKWFYQKIFDPLVDVNVYDRLAYIVMSAIQASAAVITQQTLNGSANITGTGRKRIIEVKSNGGEVDMTTFGLAAGTAGDETTLVGLDNDDVIILNPSATLEINGSWTSSKGNTLSLVYLSNKWTQVGRRG